MNKTIKRISISLFIALFIFSISFIKSSTNEVGTVHAETFEWGTISVSKLSIKAAASSSSKTIATCFEGKKVKITPSYLGKTWVQLTVGGYVGYADGRWIETAYGTASEPYKNVRSGKTNDQTVVRTTTDHSASVVVIIPKGETLQVLTKAAPWVKVKYNGKTGYCVGTKIDCNNGKTASGTAIKYDSTVNPSYAKGEAIIAYARLFLGNPYVYGGNSLTNGTDCSGFVHLIYQHFGYNITRQSYALRSDGVAVPSLSQAQPGDIICYDGHVALYMGNGAIIHASNARDGIKISPDATYRTIVAIRRIVK